MKSCVMSVILACIAVAAWHEEGHTGTYGGVDRGYAGYRVYVDASVGSLSDPSLEAAELAENQARAAGDLTAIEPALARLYRHFARGEHPYARARAWLDPRARSGDAAAATGAEARVRLWLPRPMDPTTLMGGGQVEVIVSLYLKEGATPAQADAVAAAFAACQAFGEGALAAGPARADEARDATRVAEALALEARVLSGAPAYGMYRLLAFARAHDAAIAGLAKAGDPLAIGLVAWHTRAAPPLAQVTTGLAARAPDEALVIVRVLALLAPDAQRAATLAGLRAWAAARPEPDDELLAWLDGLTP